MPQQENVQKECLKIDVFDTSAFINHLTTNGHIFTTESVIREVKSSISKLYLSSINYFIRRPYSKTIEAIKKVAKKLGDLDKLSLTDIEILALAFELKKEGNDVTLYSDDYSIQNVASFLQIKFSPIVQPKIKKKIQWKKVCTSCKKEYPYTYEKNYCLICGGKLKRVPSKVKNVD